MVIIDTSAWVEYFRDGEPSVVNKVDGLLDLELVGVGDLVYCEIMQGIASESQRRRVSALLTSLPGFNMVGFSIAEKAAANYRLLRSRGVAVRKTIDVIIGTFCAENHVQLVHHDRDFDLMAPYIGLNVL